MQAYRFARLLRTWSYLAFAAALFAAGIKFTVNGRWIVGGALTLLAWGSAWTAMSMPLWQEMARIRQQEKSVSQLAVVVNVRDALRHTALRHVHHKLSLAGRIGASVSFDEWVATKFDAFRREHLDAVPAVRKPANAEVTRTDVTVSSGCLWVNDVQQVGLTLHQSWSVAAPELGTQSSDMFAVDEQRLELRIAVAGGWLALQAGPFESAYASLGDGSSWRAWETLALVPLFAMWRDHLLPEASLRFDCMPPARNSRSGFGARDFVTADAYRYCLGALSLGKSTRRADVMFEAVIDEWKRTGGWTPMSYGRGWVNDLCSISFGFPGLPREALDDWRYTRYTGF